MCILNCGGLLRHAKLMRFFPLGRFKVTVLEELLVGLVLVQLLLVWSLLARYVTVCFVTVRARRPLSVKAAE